MRLSPLQKYILWTVYESGNKPYNRKRFIEFYKIRQSKAGPHANSGVGVTERAGVKIITQSIENLIERELMTGYGVRTPHKWFIREVKLNPKGKKIAKTLHGKQQTLPLKSKKNPKKAE